MQENNAKVKAIVIASVIAVIIAVIAVYNISKNIKAGGYYKEAVAFMDNGDYTQAQEMLNQAINEKYNYKDSADLLNTVSITLECAENAKNESKSGNHSGAVDEIKKMADCNEKNIVAKTVGEDLKNKIVKNTNENQYIKAKNLIDNVYSEYKSATGANIEEIDNISSSLTESAVQYAQDMLKAGNYSSLKNALEQLRSIDSGNEAIDTLTESYNAHILELTKKANETFNSGKGDVDAAIQQINEVLALESGNIGANQLSQTFNIYKNVVEEVKTAETAYNNGNYESALNTINTAFAKSEMAKNNYADLYNKINTARQNEIEAAKRAEEERKRAEEAAKRAEEEARQAAEREAAKNRKTQIKDFAFSNLEAWQEKYDGYNYKNEYYKYYTKYFAFDIENTSSRTQYIYESDFYFVFSTGEYKNALGGVYVYDSLVNHHYLEEISNPIRPGEVKRCVIKTSSEPAYNGDKVYFKDELITTING